MPVFLMLRSIWRYLVLAFLAWSARQLIDATFSPFGEKPLRYINNKTRKVAVKLHLAEERP